MEDNPAAKRIGVGQYDTADGFHARSGSRRVFLHRAASLVPELLPSLAEAMESVPGEALELPVYPDDGGGHEWLAQGLSRIEQVRTGITPWQNRWRLTDDWVFQELHSALCGVSGGLRAAERVQAAWEYFDLERLRPFSPIYPPTGGLPGTTGFTHSLAKPLPPLFMFSARWYPQYEFRADVARWLRKQFQHELAAYLDAVEKQMETAGLVKTSTKRPRRGGDAMQHFDWLVRFQVQGWTHRRIAAEENVAISTVADALQSTAALIGLTRRSTPAPE